MHLEGVLEPELALALARRNSVGLRAHTVEELRASYRFANLQAFLDVYYDLAATLVTEDDFSDLPRLSQARPPR
jgi:adenosine deaminase